MWDRHLKNIKKTKKKQRNIKNTKKKQKNIKKTKKEQKKYLMSQLFDFSVGGKTKNQKTSRKPKKPNNQNFSENVWSEAHVCFFLVFLDFFGFFGHDLEKIKKTQGFFWFFG